MKSRKPAITDEIRKTSCYMCACRCGIDVHMKEGKVHHIEGNRDHPVNRGVLCAKGSAGIMQHYSPARLKTPLLRVGPRGEGKFKAISWEEALEKAAAWLGYIRKTDPRKLAFFTGRDQSQSFTGWWAQQFGTPNFAAHGGFCSVNMAAAGIYTIGGAFWEFGQPDWERSEYFMIFGVAEDHDSNPIKLGLSKLKERGAKIVSVNPVRTGYSAIADEWLGITPGSDGLFILSLVHELLKAGKIDLSYLLRYTNAAALVIDDPGSAEHGLFARDTEGRILCVNRHDHMFGPLEKTRLEAALDGEWRLKDGRKARPVLSLMAEAYLDQRFDPETTAEATGIPAKVTRRIAYELAEAAFEREITLDIPWTDIYGEKHTKVTGRPVAFHAMRGISAHSNGFQTCRALHLLQILLGSIDCPGGFRFKPPYPKPAHSHPVPNAESRPGQPLGGAHLGYPLGPEHLLVDSTGKPLRIDKAFSWENPLSAHGLMHTVIGNCHAGDPYPVEILFMYMANMAWNSSMDSAETMRMLTDQNPDGSYKIPRIIYSDAYSSEMVAYADLVLPDTTYLERHDCLSMLDRPISEAEAAIDAIRWPVVEPDRDAPDRDVRGFQSALLDLGARLGLPGMVNEDGTPLYKDYADYMINHQRRPGVGPLMGYRGENGDQSGRGDPNPDQIDRYIEAGGFHKVDIPQSAQFFRHANQDYQDWAVEVGLFDKPAPVVFQLYLEPLAKFQRAAEGHGNRRPPVHVRDQIRQCFTPLPDYYPATAPSLLDKQPEKDDEEFPLYAITQRPAALYHSWGGMNAWLRQLHGSNPLYVPESLCQKLGVASGDWVWVISQNGRILVPVEPMAAVNEKTVWTWNAVGKRKGTWGLNDNAPEAEAGFLLNHLITAWVPEDTPEKGQKANNPSNNPLRRGTSDPITGQGAWFDLRVRLEKAQPEDITGRSQPEFPQLVFDSQ